MVAVLSLLVLAVLPAAASEDKSYVINSVDFYVSFDEAGNAYITEDWNVSYSGSFTRLYKDIHYADLPVIEQYSDIFVTNVTINGEAAYFSEYPENREPNSFCFTKSSENYTIQWNYPATDETVRYSISYILKDAVTVTDENRAIFCYRFIGKSFEHSIENSTIHYINPTGQDMEMRFCNRDMITMFPDGNKEMVLMTTFSYTGLLKANVNMDGTYFSQATKRVDASSVASEEKKDEREAELEDTVLGIICSVASFSIIGVIVTGISKSIITRKLKKLAEDPQEVWQATQLLIREKVSPTYVLAKYRTTSGLVYSKLFLSQILYMILAGYMDYYKDRDELVLLDQNQIGQPLAQVDEEFFQKLSEILEKKRISQSDIVENQERYIAHLKSYFNGYVRKCVVSKEAKKAAQIVRYAGERANAIGSFNVKRLDYMFIVKQGMLHEVHEEWEHNNIIDHMDYIACQDYYILSTQEAESSSSSGSSCSSCSSCSGCGGGGAD